MLCFWCLLPSSVFGKGENQTLLWRISGNGLSKPSYLFGTIHLTDKRLFRFDDSVYAAIEHTDGLAIELNLNDVAGYYINSMFEAKDNDVKLNDVLSDKELKDMEQPLSRRFNKSSKDITIKDVLKERNKWLNGYFSKGEMPTFVDAYLFERAKRMGKWVGGIEDMEDQAGLMDGADVKLFLAEDETLTLEQMIKLYINQDLEGIARSIGGFGKDYQDIVLTRRNIKMARRMDSLSAQRSMFFAVGCAHLPGDSGVISLLRARGFTVEPVYCEKRTQADKYPMPDEVEMWVQMEDKQKLYTVEVPGIPGSVMVYDHTEMKFLLDFSNLSGYCIMASVNPVDERTDEDLYRDFATNIFKRKRFAAPKRIEQDGVIGAEYIDRKDNYYIRMRLFRKGVVSYVVWMYARNEANVLSAKADRFFATLKLKPPGEVKIGSHLFVDSVLSISMNTPAVMEPSAKLNKQMGDGNESWDVIFYTGQELNTGAYTMLVGKQAKASNYISNDSTILEELYEMYKEKSGATREWTTIKGYRAMMLNGKVDNFAMKMLGIVVGNRNIVLMRLSSVGATDSVFQQMVNSIQFLYPKRADWKVRMDSAATFAVNVPNEFRTLERSNFSKERNFYSFDTLTALNYYINTDTLSAYVWTSNDSVFLYEKAKEYLAKNDVVLTVTMGSVNGKRCQDVLLRKEGSGTYQRLRLVPHGNILYVLLLAGARAQVIGEDALAFFNSFALKYAPPTDIYSYKGDRLLADLSSSDSLTRALAYNGLMQGDWQIKDKAKLLTALEQSYLPIYYIDTTTINEELGAVLAKKYGDDVVPQLSAIYRRLSSKPKLQMHVAESIAAVKTTTAFDTFFSIIRNWPKGATEYSPMRAKLSDSLELLALYTDDLVGLLADSGTAKLAIILLDNLNDSGKIAANKLPKVTEGVLAYCKAYGSAVIARTSADWSAYYLLSLLDSIKTPSTLEELARFSKAKDVYVAKKAALRLLANKREVPQDVWRAVAAIDKTRIVLYNELKNVDQLALYPKEYLKQRAFATSFVYSLADDNELEVASITSIGERKAIIGEHKFRFLLYEVLFEGDAEKYLAVIGPYELIGDELLPENDISGFYWKQPLDKAKVMQQLDAYIAERNQ